MSSRSASKQLLNSRARVYHSGASGWTPAWLYDVKLPDIWISSAAPLPANSSLTLAVQCDNASIHFVAQLESTDVEEMNSRKAPIFMGNGATIAQPCQYCYRIVLSTPMRQLPNAQNDRKTVADLAGKVLRGDDEIPVIIWDMSREGACLHSSVQLDQGDDLRLCCEINRRELCLPMSVRYSRRLPASGPLFATGIYFDAMPRVDGAVWNARFQDAGSKPARAPKQPAPMVPTAPANVRGDASELLERASELLDRMRQINVTERRLINKHLRTPEFTDLVSIADSLESNLEVLGRYRRDLEVAILETVHSLHDEKYLSQAS